MKAPSLFEVDFNPSAHRARIEMSLSDLSLVELVSTLYGISAASEAEISAHKHANRPGRITLQIAFRDFESFAHGRATLDALHRDPKPPSKERLAKVDPGGRMAGRIISTATQVEV